MFSPEGRGLREGPTDYKSSAVQTHRMNMRVDALEVSHERGMLGAWCVGPLPICLTLLPRLDWLLLAQEVLCVASFDR